MRDILKPLLVGAALAALAGPALAQDGDPPLRFAAERADGIWMQQATLMPVGDGVETLVWTFRREDQTTDDMVWDTQLRHARVDCTAGTLTYVYDGYRLRDEYLSGGVVAPQTVTPVPGEPEDEVVRLACQTGSTALIEFPDPMSAWIWAAEKQGRDLPPEPSDGRRLVLIAGDHDWATYYDMASHHSDGERFVEALILRAPTNPDDEGAWLEARFDCQSDSFQALGWYNIADGSIGAISDGEGEIRPVPTDDRATNFFRPAYDMACKGQNRFAWAPNHSGVGAIAAARDEAARALAQFNAPPTAFPQPEGPLHFIALTGWYEGVFIVPATVKRDAERSTGEATLLYVNGRLQHVAEGDIRYSWGKHRFDCMSGLIATDQRDYYGPDGALVSTLGQRAFEANEADIPWETSVMGSICLDMDPPGMQVVDSLENAIQGIVNAVPASERD